MFSLPKLTLFFVKIACLYCPTRASGNFCNKDLGEGVFKITSSPVPTSIVNLTSTTVRMSSYPEKVSVIISRKRVYTAYCYDGSSLDPNTGCDKSIKTIEINAKQAREELAKGKCMIGFTCRPGKCIGDLANKQCFDFSLTTSSFDDEIPSLGRSYYSFAQHTCIKEWGCTSKKLTLNLNLKTLGGKMKVGFDTPNNDFIEYNETLSNKGFKDKLGFTYFTIKPVESPKIKMVPMKCLGVESKGILCHLGSNTPVSGGNPIVYFDLQTKIGTYKNMGFEIMGNFTMLSGDKKTTIVYKKATGSFYKLNEEDGGQKAVSVESFKESLNSIHYIQLQSLYNNFLIEQEINELRSKFSRILSFLIPRFPGVLGTVINETIETHSIDEALFRIRRCTTHKNVEGVNCHSDKIYKHGAYVPRIDIDICEATQRENVTGINVFSTFELDDFLAEEAQIQVSSISDSPWSWLISKSLSDNMKVESESNNLRAEINEIKQSLLDITGPFSEIAKIFTWLSSVIGWVALLLHCRK